MPSRDPQRPEHMLLCVVKQCCDVSIFEKLRLRPSTRQHETAFRKDPLWRAFSKSFVFGDRKRRLRVDTNSKRMKKMRFQKYPDTCGRA